MHGKQRGHDRPTYRAGSGVTDTESIIQSTRLDHWLQGGEPIRTDCQYETIPLALERLPEGACQNGCEDFVVQALNIEAHNVCYRQLRYG